MSMPPGRSSFPHHMFHPPARNDHRYYHRRSMHPALMSAANQLPQDAPSMLLQAVVVPGEKTDEGRLIEIVAPAWFEIIELLLQDPAVMFQIDSRKWEEIIAGAYKRASFDEVVLTPRSGDLGRDIVATKRGLGSVRVIDQVKAFKPGHLVNANDVRALMGVLQTDGASKGFLTTTSAFAPRLSEDPLIKPLIPARLELVDGARLISRLKELAAVDPAASK